MKRQKSLVGGVQYMVDLNPFFINVGILPQWSMWAWDKTQALMRCGSNKKREFIS